MATLSTETDWEEVLTGEIDEATDKFISVLLKSAEAAILRKTIQLKDNQKPWMTNELNRQIRKRDRLFRHVQQHQTHNAWEPWKHQRNFVTALNRQLKKMHVESEI